MTDAIITFDSTLVVSGHPAVYDSLAACDYFRNTYCSDDCSPILQKQMISDVIMRTTRSANASLNKAYLRFNPLSTPYLSMVKEVVPEAS